eukprot:8048518-Pyramimonas_sp.AAC.1
MRGSAAAQNGSLLLLVASRFAISTYLSGRFLGAVPSFDEFDGWLELLNKWPPAGCVRYRPKHLWTVRRCLSNCHWAYQALTVLNLIGMVDNAG